MLEGPLSDLRDSESFRQWLGPLAKTEWVVYAKPPFGGPEKVLDYLGRYTHRVTIANHRLVDIANGRVTFHWRNYRHGRRKRKMTLDAEEFIRRFLLHVLPNGFVRIRYFGFLANRFRAEKIKQARKLLGQSEGEASELRTDPDDEDFRWHPDKDRDLCPHCGRGRLICVETIPPTSQRMAAVEAIDSS